MESLYVQNRFIEDGSSYNRLYFTLKDEMGQQISEDRFPQVELYDPAGNPVPLVLGHETGYKSFYFLSGEYDGATGKWQYDDDFWIDPSYTYRFSGALTPGIYQVRITVEGYPKIIYDYSSPGYSNFPVISSSSFKAYLDNSGNLIWRWDVPDIVDTAVPVYVRTFIQTTVDGVFSNKMLYIRVPVQMGFVFVPKNVLDIFLDDNEQLWLQICIRANDNTIRSYSSTIPLEAALDTQAGWDINGDGQEGVPEAIHALQTAAGLRPAED